MTPQRRAEIENELRQAGVPPDVISHVMKGHLLEWYTTAYGLLAYAVLVFGFVIGFILWIKIDKLVSDNARAHAEELGALLFDYIFGLSFVVGLFAWILVAGSLVGLLAERNHNLQINSFVFAVVGRKKSWVTEWSLRLFLRLLQTETDAARYVKKATLGSTALFAIVALVLATAGIFFGVREWRSYEAFTPTAYIDEPFFPWHPIETHEWSSAVSVTFGCQHISRRGTENNLIYTVTFADGAKAHLGSATPVRGSWLDAMEVIDRAIAMSGAQLMAWNGSTEEALDPRCIDAVYERFPGNEFERLKNVMKWVEK